GPDGTIYVGDRDQIEEFEGDGSYKGQIDFTTVHAEDPRFPSEGQVAGLAVDPREGGLYFAVGEAESGIGQPIYHPAAGGAPVGVIETDLEGLGTFKEARARIEGLAVDRLGDLYVAANAMNRVSRVIEYAPDGGVLIGFKAGFAATTDELDAITTNPVGNVYI